MREFAKVLILSEGIYSWAAEKCTINVLDEVVSIGKDKFKEAFNVSESDIDYEFKHLEQIHQMRHEQIKAQRALVEAYLQNASKTAI